MLIAITVFLGLLALLVLYRVIRQVRRKRYLAALRSVVTFAVFMVLFSAAVFLLYSVMLFKRLTYREVIAKVTVHQIAENRYEADVIFNDNHHETYVLLGDEWIMGANVIVWKPWLQVLGIKNKYQFDFLSSRFHSSARNAKTLLPDYSLSALEHHPAVMWIYDYAVLPYCIETVEGSAVYMPLKDKARYQVMLTPSGLLATSVAVP